MEGYWQWYILIHSGVSLNVKVCQAVTYSQLSTGFPPVYSQIGGKLPFRIPLVHAIMEVGKSGEKWKACSMYREESGGADLKQGRITGFCPGVEVSARLPSGPLRRIRKNRCYVSWRV